jgi:HTH-type transcriptional regulator / antitoxin HigA
LEKGIGRLAPIASERQYEKMVRLMNRLLDVVGENEKHRLAGLLNVVGELVAAYEAREVPIPDGSPRAVLRLLMEQNGLKQTDLQAELGGQPVVSAVLAGKRRINVKQARALADRFHVSPAAFVA